MPNQAFTSFSEIVRQKKTVKPPAYPWQDLALRVIKELHIPEFKRAAVFQVCKNKEAHRVIVALNDTKELAKTGSSWKYFFKIIDQK